MIQLDQDHLVIDDYIYIYRQKSIYGIDSSSDLPQPGYVHTIDCLGVTIEATFIRAFDSCENPFTTLWDVWDSQDDSRVLVICVHTGGEVK